MRRALLSLLLLPLAAPAARAHFLWLLPSDKAPVRMVFSDRPEPDAPALLKKVAHAEAFSVGVDGKRTPLKLTQEKAAFTLQPPGKHAQLVGAVCRYGVVQRGEGEPFFLTYYAKTWAGQEVPKDLERVYEAAAKFLDLDIVPVFLLNKPTGRVLWKGKPVAGAEVSVFGPGDKTTKLKTAKDGTFALPDIPDSSVAFLAKFVVAGEGEHKGKKFKESRHYATFVVPAPVDVKKGKGVLERKTGPKEDPVATKLLADARAARASWHNFPGFTADLEVNVEGKIIKGQVDVDAKGKVVLSGIDQSILARETSRQLKSVVDHRLDDSGDLKTPCAFADDNVHHPLGRAIRVLNDEFHSSYRIRGREVIVVNRSAPSFRFTITVIENRLNKEKQFLPACYVVNYWDLKSNALMRSQAFHQEWTRLGKFDLPAGVMVVTATPDGKLAARHLKLSNHKLK